jgi:prepilin-type N-terminal cleavage/methylation domain-containing protein
MEMKFRTHKKGFSLVELLVVITIMAILSVVAYVALGGQTAKARNSRRMQDLGTIQSALEIYFVNNNNRYPAALSNLVTAELMTSVPTDPSGTDVAPISYAYAKSATSKKFQLAATLEEGESFKAYVVGNSSDPLMGIDANGDQGFSISDIGVKAENFDPCDENTPITDGGSCLPYEI